MPANIVHACLFSAVLVFSTVNPPTAQGDVPDCSPEPLISDRSELSIALDTALSDASRAGFHGQLAIWQDGEWLYRGAAGYADPENLLPVTDLTMFELASVAKYLTAVMVLQAVDGGLIAVDDPVAIALSGSRLADRGTTVSELLSHQSGLGSSYVAEAVSSNEEALSAIDQQEFDPVRRGEFHYSNDGFNVLGIFLERLHGRAFEAIAYRDVLDPVCLRQSGFWAEPGLGNPQRLAQPTEGYPDSLSGRNYGMIGASGYLASASDLIRLQAAILDDRLLSPSARAELFEPRVLMSLGQASYGGFLIEHPRLGRYHSARGSNDWGTNAYLNTYFDCGIILAITTSSGRTGPENQLFRDRILAEVQPQLESVCLVRE